MRSASACSHGIVPCRLRRGSDKKRNDTLMNRNIMIEAVSFAFVIVSLHIQCAIPKSAQALSDWWSYGD